MSVMTLRVNGRPHTVDVDPTTPLLYVLSDDLQLNGPKFGCGLGQCGCCTVIVKGEAIRSCVTPVSTVQGSDIMTLEGLGSVEKPHRQKRRRRAGDRCSSTVIMTMWRFSIETQAPIRKSGRRQAYCAAAANVRMSRHGLTPGGEHESHT